MNNLERIAAHKNDFDYKGKPITAITQEMLDNMKHDKNDTFTSGRKRKVGDWVLYGFLHDKYNFSLITLHEEEYGTLYKDYVFVSDGKNTPYKDSKLILELEKINL